MLISELFFFKKNFNTLFNALRYERSCNFYKEIISLLPKCNESVKITVRNATATSTKEIISLLPKCNESVKNNEVPDLAKNTALHFRQTGRPYG
ncbi:unnamed protein product [Rhizophagus irregularis]|nr:unnamed protein product [Rhizophagus irregularis]